MRTARCGMAPESTSRQLLDGYASLLGRPRPLRRVQIPFRSGSTRMKCSDQLMVAKRQEIKTQLHAKQVLSRWFENRTVTGHTARVAALIRVVQGLLLGGKASLTLLGRSRTGDAHVKHHIKAADRLLGNQSCMRNSVAPTGLSRTRCSSAVSGPCSRWTGPTSSAEGGGDGPCSRPRPQLATAAPSPHCSTGPGLKFVGIPQNGLLASVGLACWIHRCISVREVGSGALASPRKEAQIRWGVPKQFAG